MPELGPVGDLRGAEAWSTLRRDIVRDRSFWPSKNACSLRVGCGGGGGLAGRFWRPVGRATCPGVAVAVVSGEGGWGVAFCTWLAPQAIPFAARGNACEKGSLRQLAEKSVP